MVDRHEDLMTVQLLGRLWEVRRSSIFATYFTTSLRLDINVRHVLHDSVEYMCVVTLSFRHEFFRLCSMEN